MIETKKMSKINQKEIKKKAEWCCNIQNSMLLYNIYDTPPKAKPRL